MLKCLEHLDAIYVACGPTDLRKNVDGFSILVKQSFGLDPFSKSLFLFCNGSRNRLKGLHLFQYRNNSSYADVQKISPEIRDI
jgi:transposase